MMELEIGKFDGIGFFHCRWIGREGLLLPLFSYFDYPLASLCFLQKKEKEKASLMISGVCPAYLPSIQYIAWIVSQQEISFVTNNTYQKQTYRNRAEIYSPNGKLRLSIPVIHKKSSRRQFDYEVSIDFENNWQKVHWKSLEASYRSSPCLLYTSPSPRDRQKSRMPSSA